ncbi:MAG: TonB-dependent receptor [Bradyrhizobium sp.]|nr:TonB-dependent receptor [Bradyrhizobium sp.]
MNTGNHRNLFVTCASLIALAACNPAMAQSSQPTASQDPAQAPVPGATTSEIADIVVTAEHRSARLQDTPIAIAAFGGAELQRQHITSLDGLVTKIPNVQFSQQLGMARIFIRGVGLDSQSPGADPRVAIYTDGVYNARPQAGFASFFDLDRVEVLNGPQGTLYGRNATAGAVNIITRDPTDKLSGYGTITVGNYSLVQTEGAISGPLTDTLDARLAFTTSNRGGFGKNISTGDDVDDDDRRGVRGKLLFKPGGDFRVLLEGDYWREADHGASGSHFLMNTPGNQDYGQEQGYVLPTGPFDTAGSNPHTRIKTYGGASTIDFGLAGFHLTSVTGYRHTTSHVDGNADQSTADFIKLTLDEKSDMVTQEVRLARTIGLADILVGGYYFHENNFALTVANTSSAYFPAFGASASGNCCIGIPKQPGPFVILQGGYFGGTQHTDAYALFTQETFHITSTLSLDLGVRYSYEKRNIDQFYQFDLSRPAGTLPILTAATGATYASQEASWDSLDPKVTLHYKITPDVMAYVTYTKGFKSGGFNFSQIQPAFAPEKLDDWEGGIKADFWDRRLRVNLAAFHYKYSNLQVNTVVQTSLLTTNAGGATVDGVEAQISAAPTNNLHVDLNAAWLDARYTDFTTIDPGHPQLGLQNLAGNRLQYAPRGKISGSIAYTINTKLGSFTPRADLAWSDHFFFSQFNLPYIAQKSYYLGNLYLDFDAGNGWTASAFLKNVGDKRYLIASVQSGLFLGGQAVGQYGDPRTFGVSITKRWF